MTLGAGNGGSAFMDTLHRKKSRTTVAMSTLAARPATKRTTTALCWGEWMVDSENQSTGTMCETQRQ